MLYNTDEMRFNISARGLISSPAKLQLLAHLFTVEKTDMSERELARFLGLSNFTVNQVLKEFERNNIIERRRAGRTMLWRLKKASYYSKILGPVLETLSKFPSPLEHLKATILRAYPLAKISRIYLYGSIAEKKEEYNSDVDLFIIIPSAKDAAEIEEAGARLSASCLELYGNYVQAIVVSESEYAKRRGTGLVKAVEKGMLLYSR